MFSSSVELILSIAYREATARRHTHLTLEHLLYVLAHDAEGEKILTACGADLPALRREDDKDSPRELLQSLARRDDLYQTAAREIEVLLDGQPTHDRSGSRGGARRATSPVPAGWYPDPTGRHRMRWFDGDWQDWACDEGSVLHDPL